MRRNFLRIKVHMDDTTSRSRGRALGVALQVNVRITEEGMAW